MADEHDYNYGALIGRASQPNKAVALASTVPAQSPLAYQPILYAVLVRLEDLLDQETGALRENRLDDVKFFSQRKSRALLELSRALQHLSEQDFDEGLKHKIFNLRQKLVENQSVLQIYLDAMRSVAQLIVESVFDYESDGTYSMHRASGTIHTRATHRHV